MDYPSDPEGWRIIADYLDNSATGLYQVAAAADKAGRFRGLSAESRRTAGVLREAVALVRAKLEAK